MFKFPKSRGGIWGTQTIL